MKPVSITTKLTNRDNESLKQYFRDIHDFQKFTPQEEADCADRALAGDKEAFNELINRNLRFVVTVAKQYESKDSPLGDLINEGNLGLVYAAKRFKPNKGFKFISFAVWWIRKYMTEYLTNNSRTIRIPSNKVNSLSKLNKRILDLEQKIGRTPEPEDIIHEYGDEMSSDELGAMDLVSYQNINSLDRQITQDNDAPSVCDMINDDSYYLPTDQLASNLDTVIQVQRIISTLKPRELEVITKLYGLDGNYPQTLTEVGVSLSISREGVRVIKEKILKKLRSNVKDFTYLKNISS